VTAKAAEFAPDSNFIAWACTIARFKALEQRRTHLRFSREVIDSLAASCPLEQLEHERLAPLLECLDSLAPKSREIIRLRYFSEHGPGEIARILGRTVTGVNSALIKARAVLRGCVAEKLRHAGGSDSNILETA
jgi:RNA polymerase sigma-70 factor (ECF subfamily)